MSQQTKSTRTEAQQDKIDRVIRTLDRGIQKKHESINEWTIKVQADPAYHLSWGLSAFQEAAELTVLREVREWLAAGREPREILERFQKKALNAGSQLAQSSSPTSNLMADYERKALADQVVGIWAVLPGLVNDLEQVEGKG